jgi:hypothetical protein
MKWSSQIEKVFTAYYYLSNNYGSTTSAFPALLV